MITLTQALADLFVTALVVGLLSFLFGRYYQEWHQREWLEDVLMVAEARANDDGLRTSLEDVKREFGLFEPEPPQDAGGHVRVVREVYDQEAER